MPGVDEDTIERDYTIRLDNADLTLESTKTSINGEYDELIKVTKVEHADEPVLSHLVGATFTWTLIDNRYFLNPSVHLNNKGSVVCLTDVGAEKDHYRATIKQDDGQETEAELKVEYNQEGLSKARDQYNISIDGSAYTKITLVAPTRHFKIVGSCNPELQDLRDWRCRPKCFTQYNQDVSVPFFLLWSKPRQETTPSDESSEATDG